MEKVKHINTLRFLLSNRRKPISGIPLSQNKNITSIINNPVDYLIDGIVFINNSKIKEIIVDSNDFKEKIIDLKFNICLKKDERYLNKDFQNFKELFSQIKKINTFCELSLSKESIIYIGKIINIKEESIDVDFYDTNFKLMDNAFVEFKDITTVTVFSDYADTICNVVLKKYPGILDTR